MNSRLVRWLLIALVVPACKDAPGVSLELPPPLHAAGAPAPPVTYPPPAAAEPPSEPAMLPQPGMESVFIPSASSGLLIVAHWNGTKIETRQTHVPAATGYLTTLPGSDIALLLNPKLGTAYAVDASEARLTAISASQQLGLTSISRLSAAPRPSGDVKCWDAIATGIPRAIAGETMATETTQRLRVKERPKGLELWIEPIRLQSPVREVVFGNTGRILLRTDEGFGVLKPCALEEDDALEIFPFDEPALAQCQWIIDEAAEIAWCLHDRKLTRLQLTPSDATRASFTCSLETQPPSAAADRGGKRANPNFLALAIHAPSRLGFLLDDAKQLSVLPMADPASCPGTLARIDVGGEVAQFALGANDELAWINPGGDELHIELIERSGDSYRPTEPRRKVALPASIENVRWLPHAKLWLAKHVSLGTSGSYSLVGTSEPDWRTRQLFEYTADLRIIDSPSAVFFVPQVPRGARRSQAVYFVRPGGDFRKVDADGGPAFASGFLLESKRLFLVQSDNGGRITLLDPEADRALTWARGFKLTDAVREIP